MKYVLRNVMAMVCVGGLISAVGCMAQPGSEGGASQSAGDRGAPIGEAQEATHVKGGTGGSCSHTTCNIGGPLSESCSSCASLVCNDDGFGFGDEFCCTVAWDDQCVFEALGFCRFPTDSTPGCTSCPSSRRGLCVPSATAFDFGCNSCTQTVCGQPGFARCCTGRWDSSCAVEANRVCGLGCALTTPSPR